MRFFSVLSPTGGKSISSPSHSAKGEREVKSPHPSVDRTRDEDAATPASSIGGVKTDRTARTRYTIVFIIKIHVFILNK